MTTIGVSDASQLTSALASAQAGDVISLSAGDYGDLSIRGKAFASDVTITSADPLHAAVIRSLDIESSSGIHLNDVNVNFTPTAATLSFSSAVMINASHGITISGGVMTGGAAVNGVAPTATALDSTGNVLGLPTGRGITIQGSSNVNITGTDISHFDRGVVLNNATTTTLDGNNIHDLRRTAIDGTGDHLTIENNNLHDSHPWRFGDTADGGDHADFIALWTDAGQTTASSNIVITGNTMSQGAGAPILGMWVEGSATAGFTNVTVSGNVIETANDQGIMLGDVVGGSVSNNTLLQPTGGATPPLIILQSGAANIAVSGNLVSSVVDQNSGFTGNTVHDNTVVQSANATATGYYDASLVSKVAGLTPDQVYSTVEHGVTFVADTTPAGPAVTAQSLLTVTGGTVGKALVGGYSLDNLTGGVGADTLVGNGGGDTLTGGAGNDTYVVPNSLATIVEQAGGGTDTVIAKGDHTLEANVENLVIDTGNGWAGTGNGLNNVIIGNASGNNISGADGDDTLDGGLGNDQINGGAGADVLLGGGGNDTLTGGAGADTFVIAQGFGADKVADFSQAQGDTIEAVGPYTTAQVGADTVVTLATGDHITLTGVSMASLKAGWIAETDSLFGSPSVAAPPVPDLTDTPGDPAAITPNPDAIMAMMTGVGMTIFAMGQDL